MDAQQKPVAEMSALVQRRAALRHLVATIVGTGFPSAVFAATPEGGALRPDPERHLSWSELAELRAVRIAETSCVTTSPAEIAEKVKKLVVEHLGVDEQKVTPEASFIDDLGADSLDTVELVMAFEEAFGVEIPEDAAEKIVKVQDAVSFIERSRCR
jgi:acyl carrier protein